MHFQVEKDANECDWIDYSPKHDSQPSTSQTYVLECQKESPPQSTRPSSSRCSSVNSSELSSCSKDAVSPIIPSHWCEQTQACIDKKMLNPKARCDIVRTLGTLLVAKHGPHPTKQQVEYIARQLILTFPFPFHGQ